MNNKRDRKISKKKIPQKTQPVEKEKEREIYTPHLYVSYDFYKELEEMLKKKKKF